MIALVSLALVHAATHPASATCARDQYLATGIRSTGVYRCYQRIDLEEWPARDKPMGAFVEGRIYCTAPTRPVVTSARSIACR